VRRGRFGAFPVPGPYQRAVKMDKDEIVRGVL
jgi:hypothetical protein